ncbi:MAG: hypothetical protein ACR2MM_07645 [Flavobacteriaceae bacterium]
MLGRYLYIVLAWVFLMAMHPDRILGQTRAGDMEVYKSIPQEGVYLHQNSTLLFAGERLYFKVYCLNLDSNGLSELSKIAYVSLIDENLQPVFRQKIRLVNGTGQGDFSIPAEVQTGSYKLIGYTSWMLSRPAKQFFESDLIIINPYKATAESLLEKQPQDSIPADSLRPIPDTPIPVKMLRNISGENLISVAINRASFAKRSAVQVDIRALKASANNGSYSMTVRKVDSMFPSVGETAVSFWMDKSNTRIPGSATSQVIPEIRGELFSGRVVSEANGTAIPGKRVVLSLPGDPYIMDLAHTDKEGRFYFNLDTPVNSTNAIFQIFDENREAYILNLDEHRVPDFGSLEFPSFTLNNRLESRILQRSINNQIENAYAIAKSDTVVKPKEDIPFYRNYQQEFFLDDYTRFNTLRETMVEIIDNAWIDENGDDDPTFGVRPFDGYLDAGLLKPIVFMDGLLIQDHKDIVNYNSKEVRRIFISQDRYLMGPSVFQGLVALETKSGEFYESFYREFLINRELFRPEAKRAYFFENHGGERATDRLPDFRYQLYWNPKLTLSDKSTSIQFYTSDIKGIFEIELKGYSVLGEPVSIIRTFQVE